MEKKRDKKTKFKSIKDKLKARGFDARVQVDDKESASTYLNEEWDQYATRVTELRDK